MSLTNRNEGKPEKKRSPQVSGKNKDFGLAGGYDIDPDGKDKEEVIEFDPNDPIRRRAQSYIGSTEGEGITNEQVRNLRGKYSAADQGGFMGFILRLFKR